MGAFGAQIGLGLLDSMYTPQVTEDLHVAPDGSYVDASGQPTTPYVKPGFMSRVISPTARQIANLDAESSLAPMEAARENSIRNTVGGSNFAKMRNAGVTGQGFQGLPDDVGYMANPSMSPSGYGTQGTSILNNRGGIQGLSSSTDITQAQTMLEAAKRMASRQPVIEATTDANAATGLKAATQLTPTLTDNEIARAGGEASRMGGEQANLTRQQQLTALSQHLQGTELNTEQGMADTDANMLPVSQRIRQNEIYRNLNNSTYGPVGSGIASIVDGNGNMSVGYNPLGLNKMQSATAEAGGGLPASTTVMGPDGRNINVPRSIRPSVTALSQGWQGPHIEGSGPSTRPTVEQASKGQEQPRTISVTDTQAKQFLPTVSDGLHDTYPMPEHTEDWLKNAWNADAPIAKKGAIHTGRVIMNIMRLIQAQKMGEW